MQEAPGQHADGIVGEEMPRGQQQQGGNDEAVDGNGAVAVGQAYFPATVGGGVMRAPQEQTMLRVRHSMRRSRPQAVHPR